jgi:DNA-binding NarL/FixJ family response regulator
MIRVLVADDEPLIRDGIRFMLSAAGDMEVVAQAGTGRAAVEAVRSHRLDVVLLDIQMPDMNGLQAVEELHRLPSRPRIAMLTTFGEDDYIATALHHGVAGFLLKDSAQEELVHAVRVIAGGGAYLSPAVTGRVIERFVARDVSRSGLPQKLIDRLSDREREILVLLGAGLSNANIAAHAFTTEATIKVYVSRILSKLECENRVQAAILAVKSGMVDDAPL